MKQTSEKSIRRHLAAVKSGKVTKTNVIGIRKAINSMERGDSPELIDAIFELEQAIAKCEPTVTGELHESGLVVLRNRRYAKRWTDAQRAIIDDLSSFRLVGFDRIGHRGWQGTPVYRAIAKGGRSFTFRNIPWQTAYYAGFEDGPRVVPERD